MYKLNINNQWIPFDDLKNAEGWKEKMLTAMTGKSSHVEYPEDLHKVEEVVKSETSQHEGEVSLVKKLSAAEIKAKIHKPENHKQILSAYQNGYSTGSIAKSLGLEQDKQSRSLIRALLRKAGVYKEKGQPKTATAKGLPAFEKVEYHASAATTEHEKAAAPIVSMIGKAQEYGTEKCLEAFKKYNAVIGINNGQEMIQSTIKHWVGSSHSQGAQVMKAIACEYYGKDVEFEPKLSIPLSELSTKAQQVKTAFLAQKEFVKAWVKQYGAKKVMRGLKGQVVNEIKKQIAAGATEIELTSNVLSSWSESHAKAKSFSGGKGGVILSMPVDPENVWACYGCESFAFASFMSEKEYVMGLPGKTFKIAVKDLEFT